MKKDSKFSASKRTEILVAEDSPTQATQIKHLLQIHNYKVVVAQDGKQAMDLILKHKPSLVISDILMPEMNGYELSKKIKSDKNTEYIPVILLTRLSDPEEIIEGLSCGADCFITKPFNEKHLLSSIERLLSTEPRVSRKKVPFGVQITFNGEERTIQAEQENVIKLMLSIYEGAILQNEKLIQTREELKMLNEKLESIVEDRTADLKEEIKLSNQITEKLQESEEKWLTLVTTIPESIALVSCEGKLLFMNHIAKGFSEKETIGRSHLDLIPDEWKEFYRQKFEKCIITQDIQTFEYTAFGGCNSLRTYETNLVPIIDQRRIVNVITIARDITERKQADEKIKFLVSRQEAILAAVPNIIMEVNKNKIYTWSNKSGFEFFGNDVIGKNVVSFFVGEQDTCNIVQPLFDGLEDKIYVESLQRNKDREERLLAWWCRALRDDNGNITGTLSSALDITDRTLAEKVIRENEKKYHDIFDNVTDLYIETSLDGKILEASPSINILSKGKYSSNDLIGRSMSEFFTDSMQGQSLLKELQEHGCVTDFEILLKNRDGSFIPCSVSSKISFDANGKPEKIIGSMRDSSQRKDYEEKLIKAKEKAEESDRLKTAFLHNISHEIRTPMNAICGFSALLSEPGLDAITQQSFIETITQSSNHLLAIISDIVDISNIEANTVKTLKTAADVNIILKNVVNLFSSKAGEKKIELTYKSELSDSDAPILTDNIKLTQILTNLINNALKFTHYGSVKVNCKRADNFLEFSVSDTGIGIPAEHHEKIFDRFYQVQNDTTRLYEGTGLGLAISKAYTELLGGKIWLLSEKGKGTTFLFTIPYERQSIVPLPVIEKSPSDSFAFPVKKTILVAEDIDSNFKMIEYFLSDTNAVLLRAKNGKEAVEIALKEKNINLILMDIKMPGMDGYTAVELIRAANKTIPIIAQTAYADDRERTIEVGCNGFISKPFDKKNLINSLCEYL